jgi:RNA polymerase-binding transcription factor DksA
VRQVAAEVRRHLESGDGHADSVIFASPGQSGTRDARGIPSPNAWEARRPPAPTLVKPGRKPPTSSAGRFPPAGRVRTLLPVDDEAARSQLADEHARLERLRAGLENGHLRDEPEEDSAAELSHLDQHPADVASEAFEREKEFSILEQVEAELADVDRALARLDDGTYGRCDACGGPIGEERLAALPAARFCVQHQGDVEA